jgi:hypothetical protein
VVPDKSMRRDGKKATGGTGPPVVCAFYPLRAAPRSGCCAKWIRSCR